MDCFARHELEVAALYRGIEGFGIGRRIHTERFPDISTDLPLIAEAIDTREKIESVLPDVHAIIDKGLVTIEHSLLAVGEDARTAEFPDGAGSAGRLTVYCGRGERSAGRHGLPGRRRSAAPPGCPRRHGSSRRRRDPQRTALARRAAEP